MTVNTKQTRTKSFLGIPFDFRKLSFSKAKSRYWNPRDVRLFTPRLYGAGWTLNIYWLRHPYKYYKQHYTL